MCNVLVPPITENRLGYILVLGWLAVMMYSLKHSAILTTLMSLAIVLPSEGQE